jgi:thiamine pyrophosphate-dependent acetolactate synthase large subunit-like protein
VQVSELVGFTVAQLGVGYAFGVVGSGNFAMTNALRSAGVPFLAARHEGGAASMADAYARTSGLVAVLSVHQGPGLTNAVTGITEAAKSRTPLLVLAADVAASAVRSNFRIDSDALVAATGAVPERVHSAASAVDDVVRAWRTAAERRRTVVLSVPLDVQAQPVEPRLIAPPPGPAPLRPQEHSVEEFAGLLDAAERPVFLGGRGAVAHGRVLRDLAARRGALLTTSAVAKGLFEGDPYDLGVCGGFASPLAAELIVDADLLVAWGCSLTHWTTRSGALIDPLTVVVQVDDDEAALGLNQPITLGVPGDVGRTALALHQLVALHYPDGEPAARYRRPDVQRRIAAEGRWADVATEDLSTAETIDPRVLSREIDRRVPRERVVVTDSGNFMGYPAAYFSVPDAAGFCFTQSFQSVGLGLGSAIGAAVASPGRVPVLATGDGGLLMAAAELETAVRAGLGLVIVVYNDHAYGAEVHHFGPGLGEGADLETVIFPDTDLAAVGRGYGCDGITVRTVADVDGLDSWLAGPRDRPLLIDAKISNDGGSWWLTEAFRP